MIAHQNVGADRPSHLAANRLQTPEKFFPVPVIPENRLKPVASRQHVIGGVLVFDAQGTGPIGQAFTMAAVLSRIIA